MFWIRCSRSGGRLGDASGPLKSDGQTRKFATRENAQFIAFGLMSVMNGPHATASYLYTVEEDLEVV